MKNSKSRVFLVFALVLIAVFAMSSFAMAYTTTGPTIQYFDKDGNHLTSYDQQATLNYDYYDSSDSDSDADYTSWSITFTTRAIPTVTGYNSANWLKDANWSGGTLYGSTTVTLVSGSYNGVSAPTVEWLVSSGRISSTVLNLTAQYTARTDIGISLYDLNVAEQDGLMGILTNKTFDTEVTLPDDDLAVAAVLNGVNKDVGPMTKDGYIFLGWKDRVSGIVYSENAAGNILYPITTVAPKLDAVWVKDETQFFDVNFVDPISGVLYKTFHETINTEITVPGVGTNADPKPAKEGYTFGGWYAAGDPTTIIDAGATEIVKGNRTLYAKFTANDYNLTKQSTLITSVQVAAADVTKANIGDTVTFTVTPDNGNAVDQSKVTATKADGTALLVQLTGENPNTGVCTYQFTMPASNVVINAGQTQNVFGINKAGLANYTANISLASDNANTAITTAKVGAVVKIVLDPAEGYAIDNDSIAVANALNTIRADVYDITTAEDGTVTGYFNMPASNVTVTANAKQNVFGITVAEHNVDIVAPATGVAGKPVTFTVTPDAVPAGDNGISVLGNVTVKDNAGNTIPVQFVSETGDTVTLGFNMPYSAVTIDATASVVKAQHQIIFLKYDNTLLGTETVEDKDTFSPAANGYIPETRAGYTFDGWYITQTVDGVQEYGGQFANAAGASNYSVQKDLVVKQYYEGAALKITSGTDTDTLNDTVKVLSVVSDYTKSDNSVTQNTGDLKLTNGFCDTQTGANVQFTVQSEEYYQIDKVAVRPTDDASTTVIPLYQISFDKATDTYTYSFTMPAEAVEIVVYTTPLDYTLSVTEVGDAPASGQNNQYTINKYYTGNLNIAQGKTATVKVDLIPGYKIKTVNAQYKPDNAGTSYCDDLYLTDDGGNAVVLNNYAPADGETEFNFTMPCANVAFTITYEKIGYEIDTTTSNNATYNSITSDELLKQGTVVATNTVTNVSGDATTNITGQVGDLIQLKVAPQHGYELKNLSVTYGANNQTMSVSEINNPASDTEKFFKFNMPAEEVTVTATFKKEVYTVTFKDYDDKSVNSQFVKYLGTPEMMSDLTREGYDFLGWASEDVRVPVTEAAPSKDAADFVIVKDTVIKAVYAKHTYGIEYGTTKSGSYVNETPENGLTGAVGTITYANGYDVANPTEADFQDTVSFNVKAADGYQIKEVKAFYYDTKAKKQSVDFESEPASMIEGGAYTFIMPNCSQETGKDKVYVSATFEKRSYGIDIVVNDKDGGNVWVKSSDATHNDAKYDELVPINIAPKEGYDLTGLNVTYTASGNVYKDFTVDATGGIYTFNMPSQDVTVNVTFTPHVFNISYNAPANGTITLNDTTKAYKSEASFTVTPDTGYQIKEVTGTYKTKDGKDYSILFTNKVTDLTVANTYKFIMPEADVKIKVLFEERTYEAALTVVGDGTTKLQDNETKIETTITENAKFKEVVTVTAKPDAGYELTGLTVTERASGNAVTYNPDALTADGTSTYTFAMPADNVDIVVTYTTKSYAINYNTPANGLTDATAGYTNGYADANPTAAKYKEVVTFSAKPAEGYQIASAKVTWKDKAGVTNTVTLDTVPADLKVGGNYTFVMPETSVNVEVLYEKQTYNANLTVVGEGGGLANVQDQQTSNSTSVEVKYDEVVTVKATPFKGYILSNITVNKVNGTQEAVTYSPAVAAAGGEYTFNMPSDSVNIVVTFVPKEYNITYNTPANGSIDPKDTKGTYGSVADFTVTPDTGYQIKSVKATWKSESDVTETIKFDTVPSDLTIGGVYAFVMPKNDVNVVVEFEEQTYNVDLTVVGKAKVDLNNTDQTKTTAKFASTVTVKVLPLDGWELKSVTAVQKGTNTAVDITPATINSNGGTYALVMPSSDVSITVTAVKKNNDISAYAISFTGDDHGTISIPIGTSADYGDTVKVVSDPDDGYRFKAISVKAADGSYVPVSFVGETAEYVTTHSFTMPDCAVEIYVTFEQYSASNYTDVRVDDWYYEAIQYVSDRGYFKGTSATLFEPNINMNRAMFVTVLSRVAGVDTSAYTTTTFTDVDMSTWYGPAVQWAYSEGIIKGYGGNLFGPEDSITREQMANIMYNFCAWSKYDILTVENPTWVEKFDDYNQISDWALPSMKWAVSVGLMHGRSDTVLDPLGTATRAEVAQVVKNLCDKVLYE